MKTAILYYSKHHENTKKVLDAITEKNDVTLINVLESPNPDLSDYERIGFASGIYYSKFHKTLLAFAEENFPEGKETFFLYTYGAKKDGYTKAIASAVSKHHAKILGEFGCFGFNTFGPFKLVGGIAKGHPNQDDFAQAIAFYQGL